MRFGCRNVLKPIVVNPNPPALPGSCPAILLIGMWLPLRYDRYLGMR